MCPSPIAPIEYPISPTDRHRSGIICLAPGDVGEAFRRLKAARIICSLREGAIRLSPHAYNTVAEMERVAAVLEERRTAGALSQP